MQVIVHIGSEVLTLDVTSSRYLANIVDTFVPPSVYFNVLGWLWLNLFVDEID
jgi:hypothetical protein